MNQTNEPERSFSPTSRAKPNPFESPQACEPPVEAHASGPFGNVNKPRLYFAVIWMNLLFVLPLALLWLKLPPEVLFGCRVGTTVVTGLAIFAALSAVSWRVWFCLFFLLAGLVYGQYLLWTDFGVGTHF